MFYFTDVQCLHRYNKVLKPGLQKGSWTEYEDAVVRHEVMMYGSGKIKWALIADKLPGMTLVFVVHMVLCRGCRSVLYPLAVALSLFHNTI